MERLLLTFALLINAIFASAQVTSGTAFAVAPQLLVTNHHVIAGCTSVDVIASDGRRIGSVIDADAQIDLALLRVNGLRSTTASLRNPRNVLLGESVMVFGFPLIGSLTSGGNFTSGLVSGLRGLRDAAGEIQITAPVQSGNSGGPLLDASGLIVGVVQAKLDALRAAIATGDIPQNVNFAISLESLANFLAKNNVPFQNGRRSSALETSEVAQLAQSFTYRIECRYQERQAATPPTSGAVPQLTPPQRTLAQPEPKQSGTPTSVRVTNITMGKAIGPNKKVTVATESFGFADTMYAAVETAGAGDARLLAKWTFHRGSRTADVSETTETIVASGPAVTTFRVSKPSGWPSGDYRIEIFLDDVSVGVKKFVVR